MPDSTARGTQPGPNPASAEDPHPSVPALAPDVPSNGGILRAFLRRLRRREKNEAVREAIVALPPWPGSTRTPAPTQENSCFSDLRSRS